MMQYSDILEQIAEMEMERGELLEYIRYPRDYEMDYITDEEIMRTVERAEEEINHIENLLDDLYKTLDTLETETEEAA